MCMGLSGSPNKHLPPNSPYTLIRHFCKSNAKTDEFEIRNQTTSIQSLGRRGREPNLTAKYLLPISHNTLITNVNKHLELLDLLVLLTQLLMKSFNLILPVVFALVELILEIGDFGAELSAELLLESHGWLLVEGRQRLHGGSFDTGWVTLDGCAGIVDVTGQVANFRIISVKNFKGFLYRNTYIC